MCVARHVGQVLAALRHHSGDADVQSLGCAALRNITCGDDGAGLARKQVRVRACAACVLRARVRARACGN